MLASGGDQRSAMELAAQLGVDFLPLVDPALLAIYRRQQELLWTEGLVERIEDELEAAGALRRSGRVPAMFFLDLAGYTRLTEEQGDAAAADLAETLAVLVNRSAREHGGVPVKWLGDGVMVHYGSRQERSCRRYSWWPSSRGRPAAGPCRGRGRAGGGPGRRLLRPHRQPGRPDRRPPAPGRCWSARAWPSRSRPRACASRVGEQLLKGMARPVRLLEASRT